MGKIAPTGCIGPDVYFSNVMATTITNKKTVYSFCNPDGYKGSAVSTFTLAENMNLYVKAAGTDVAGVDTYVKKTIGSVHTYAALDANEVAAMRQVWDPIMAAQLTDGNGKTAKTVANIALDNPAMKELLEGQAFYAA